ncbi:50S ribosomal protein L3 N(5)-glutamine methyltransferase [Litoribrevibacter euphylliae]|uniref:Ribosomal protein uL3 glutamine methyltransferase n=1 Tax=Litoribrevibacter euphylliae TaxID=1834034 RepID=A0ABV7HGW4_9GAMM
MTNINDWDTHRAITELRTIKDMCRWCYSRMNESDVFFGHGTNNAWDESTQLVLNTLSLPWHSYENFSDAGLTTTERQKIIYNLKARLHERTPLPYIFNQAWFCDLPFYVDERVLIPRSPIAELLKKHLQPWLAYEPARILDMCTGSGCIGIAAAYEFPESEVDLVDISLDALEVAQQNIDDHHLTDRVFPMQSDLFKGIPEGVKYDIIIANPPYVDREDFDAMPSEFVHEPAIALISGNDGMDAPGDILRNALKYLCEDGLFIMEVGYSMHNLEQAFPGIDFNWLELENGGDGIFIMTYEELKANQEALAGN